MSFSPSDHTFIVCAYRESPYLEACVRSVIAQGSRVAIATSTPCSHISAVAEKYGLPVFINEGEAGIAGDWNFALSCASTPLVTLAHQDDIYKDTYLSRMLAAMNKARNPILFSSDYGELRGTEEVTANRLLTIKKILRLPMRLAPGTRVGKRLSLAFGDSICCPSVTYVREIILAHPFASGLRAGLDWQKWEELSRLPGEFVYCPEPLMLHRIHAGSETSNVIGDTGRMAEDYAMFCRFHGKPVAKLLAKLYSASEKSNEL